MAWQQFFYRGEDGIRSRNVVELKIGVERAVIQWPVDAILQQCLHFRSEDEFVVIEQVEQGFDAIAVAGNEEGLLLFVVDAESEKTVELCQALLAIMKVELEQYLGV